VDVVSLLARAGNFAGDDDARVLTTFFLPPRVQRTTPTSSTAVIALSTPLTYDYPALISTRQTSSRLPPSPSLPFVRPLKRTGLIPHRQGASTHAQRRIREERSDVLALQSITGRHYRLPSSNIRLSESSPQYTYATFIG